MNKSILSVAIAATATLGSVNSAQASDFTVTVTNVTSGVHFTPLIVAAHSPSASMFQAGTVASMELQALAEGGDTSLMADLLSSIGADVATGDALVVPGATAAFDISTDAGNSMLSIAGMLLPTNDGFVGLNSVALPADDGESISFTALGYDAGTEANDELVGSGAPGEAGFPAPPPVVATGTGTQGTGVNASVEGIVSVHRGVLGDLDATGGVSDINSAVHQWHNPVAMVTVTRTSGGSPDDDGDGAPSRVTELTGIVYSRSALEIFWQAASSEDSVETEYEIFRDGELIETRDGASFFDENLDKGTTYEYEVRAVDAEGNRGPSESVTLTTND